MGHHLLEVQIQTQTHCLAYVCEQQIESFARNPPANEWYIISYRPQGAIKFLKSSPNRMPHVILQIETNRHVEWINAYIHARTNHHFHPFH